MPEREERPQHGLDRAASGPLTPVPWSPLRADREEASAAGPQTRVQTNWQGPHTLAHSQLLAGTAQREVQEQEDRAGGEQGGRQVQGTASRGDGMADPHSQLRLSLTVVLDDALEVVCHQRPESPFVR